MPPPSPPGAFGSRDARHGRDALTASGGSRPDYPAEGVGRKLIRTDAGMYCGLLWFDVTMARYRNLRHAIPLQAVHVSVGMGHRPHRLALYRQICGGRCFGRVIAHGLNASDEKFRLIGALSLLLLGCATFEGTSESERSRRIPLPAQRRVPILDCSPGSRSFSV